MNRSILKLVLVVVAVMALLATPANAGADFQAATSGPTLTGEVLESSNVVITEFNCDPTGETRAYFRYRTEGVAAGPYPGTFIETGIVYLEPLFGVFAGAVAADEMHAEFTIFSGSNTITGQKDYQLSPGEFGFRGSGCHDENNPAPIGSNTIKSATGQIYEYVGTRVSYDATISTPAGTYHDTGVTPNFSVTWSQYAVAGGTQEFSGFYEDYRSDRVVPVDTYGKATGGGQVASPSDTDQGVTFGFTVEKREDPEFLKGQCNVVDHATGDHIVCRTVTDYQQIGNTVTFEGTADVNGVEEEYRITVQDNGEPNQGVDTFSIVTDSYEAAGNVPEGNVQVHPQKLEDIT